METFAWNLTLYIGRIELEVRVTKLTDVGLLRKACEFTIAGKSNVSLDTMYRLGHSPIRSQIFVIEMRDIPAFVSTHLARHHVGVDHFVQTLREDRRDIHTSTTYGDMTQAAFYEIFNYSDGKLYWKNDRGNAAKAGSLAGTLHKKTGYWQISLNNTLLYRHRIIYLMHYGQLPQYVDHIDRNKGNDTITNLRPATASENAANAKVSIANTLGYKGVSYRKTTGRFYGRIRIDSVTKYLGDFDTPEAAAKAYDRAAIKYFGEYAKLNFPIPNREWPVNHMMIINAEALINMARKRLCTTAHEETRRAMQEIVREVSKVDEALSHYLVPNCLYRGFCPEIKSCGFMPSGYMPNKEK